MAVVQEVLVLFLMMLAGFYARRRGLMDAAVNRGLAELVLNVTLPLMILGSFNITIDPGKLRMAGQIFVISTILHAGSFWASAFLYRKYTGQVRDVLRFSAVFSNCAFMGFPVLQSVYGKIGVFYASIFAVPFMLGLWTGGVLLFNGRSGETHWKKVLFNPGIMAVACGLMMFLFSWHLPGPLARASELLGSTTTPLSMVLIGSMMAEMRVREILGGGAVYYAAAVRLIFIPLVLLSLLYLCGVRGIVMGVCVLSAAMPVAANTVAFAEKYHSDALLGSRCVLVSTLLSMVTIPVMIALVAFFG